MRKLDVEVWLVNLDRAPGDVSALSRSERARAARLKRPRDRTRSLKAHFSVRRILADKLRVHPQSVQFGSANSGKPFISTPSEDLEFNPSHSGRYCLIAVTKGRSVGVDIEVRRPLADLLKVAQQIATSREANHLRHLPRLEAHSAFFDLWTRKEAVLKATGDGFLVDPREVEVGIGPGRCLVDFRQRLWTVETLRIEPDAAAAVAFEGMFDVPVVLRSILDGSE